MTGPIETRIKERTQSATRKGDASKHSTNTPKHNNTTTTTSHTPKPTTNPTGERSEPRNNGTRSACRPGSPGGGPARSSLAARRARCVRVVDAVARPGAWPGYVLGRRVWWCGLRWCALGARVMCGRRDTGPGRVGVVTARVRSVAENPGWWRGRDRSVLGGDRPVTSRRNSTRTRAVECREGVARSRCVQVCAGRDRARPNRTAIVTRCGSCVSAAAGRSRPNVRAGGYGDVRSRPRQGWTLRRRRRCDARGGGQCVQV